MNKIQNCSRLVRFYIKYDNSNLKTDQEAQLLLIAGIVVTVLLISTYAFMISLSESMPSEYGSSIDRQFTVNNAIGITKQIASWNAGVWNTSLSWDARTNLSTELWDANRYGFNELNSLLLSRGLTITVQSNATLAEEEAQVFSEAYPGLEYDIIGAFVMFNATLFTGGGIPYFACALHATCLDIHVYGSGMHIWCSEVVVVD